MPPHRVWLMLAFSTFACSGRPGGAVLTPSDTAAHLHRTQASGSQERFRLVIRDRASYGRLMDKLTTVVDRGVDASVDFRRSEVIAVSFGQIGGYGPAISVDSVIDTRGERRIVVRRISSGGCPEGAAVTNPIDIVVVPASPPSTTVRWDERESTRGDCGDPLWNIHP